MVVGVPVADEVRARMMMPVNDVVGFLRLRSGAMRVGRISGS